VIWRCIKTVRRVPRTVSLRTAYQQEWLLRADQWYDFRRRNSS
jgi:hypothetical protein